jgi:hypothetical protein
LPGAWLERLLATRERWDRVALPVDPRALLRDADREPKLLEEIRAVARAGRTDVLAELTTRVEAIVRGPEVQLLAAKGELRLAALEALSFELPGDARERIFGALAANALAVPLVELDPASLLNAAFTAQGVLKRLDAWGRDPKLRHRAELVALGVRLFLERHPDLAALRRSNTLRANLGHVLARLPERAAMPLVEALLAAGIAPIRPS